ncbi:MAG TPA: DUF488 domain-containing protein [Terriglobales bacterium]|nr:DUF488 domain-containing protein [Terriglobales bacterium]
MAILYTIGHSTRTIEDLIHILRGHEIQSLVDIRAFPMSRRLPHFNREVLEASLHDAGIRYLWMKGLGGYRKKVREDSPNTGLRNASFRNYADYMLTPEFDATIAELIQTTENSRTAYMCAERMWFQCHRMLVSDWLAAHGHTVLHIDGEGAPKPHRLTAEAHLVGNQLVYGADLLFH